MSIQSSSDLYAAQAAEKAFTNLYSKNALGVAAQAAGLWYDLSKGAGSLAWDAVIGSGTNLTFQPVSDNTTTTAVSAAAGSNITGTTFTDTTHGSGRFTVGMALTGTGVTAGTYITALGTGTGSNNGGTYTVNISHGGTGAQTITGTATANFPYTGGNVSPDQKRLIFASAVSSSLTCAPAYFQLVDIIGFIPVSTVTLTSAQTILGSQTYPRYADGKGVMAYITPVVAMGAGTPTLKLDYTRPSTGGTDTGRLTPVAPSLPVANASAPVGQIVYSGTGVGKYGPFMPLQGGDPGILSIQSITQSATMTSGVYVIVLCKPIGLPIPLTTLGVPGERDFWNQIPNSPVIHDGACLSWLMLAGAATPVNTPYNLTLAGAWG